MSKDLIKRIHQNALDKGFHKDITLLSGLLKNDLINAEEYTLLFYHCINSKLALINTEIAECTEAIRSYDDEHLGEELADVAIRLMDLSELLSIDLEAEISRKVEINNDRPYLHGKRL